MEKKKCSKCNITKETSCFYFTKEGKIIGWCKSCRKELREKNKEELNKYQKKKRSEIQKNPILREKRNLYNSIYASSQKIKEYKKEYQKRYMEDDKKKEIAYSLQLKFSKTVKGQINKLKKRLKIAKKEQTKLKILAKIEILKEYEEINRNNLQRN